MRTREAKRLIPERADMLLVDLPDFGEHAFSVPSALKLAKLARSISVQKAAVALGLIEQLQDKTDTATDLFMLAQEVGPELLQAAGAMIGWSWMHVDLDLESDPSLPPLVYGEAVFEELHAAGYPLALLALLAFRLGARAGERATITKEAIDRLGFINGRKAEIPSLNSTSESTISVTPGATES
jgi:hypothetical protein